MRTELNLDCLGVGLFLSARADWLVDQHPRGGEEVAPGARGDIGVLEHRARDAPFRLARSERARLGGANLQSPCRVGLCSQSCSAPATSTTRKMRGASRAPRPFSRPRGENATTRDECSEFSHPPSVHARATDATRAHPVAGIRAFFSPARREPAFLTFLNPRLHPAQGQRQGEPRERSAPVSYRRAGVWRRRLPRRRCPLPRRRPGALAAGARTPRRARGPRQPHAQRARRRRGVHARVPGARRAQGQGHRPEDEAP